MASITKRGDSYRITVSCGIDKDGVQIRRTLTWKPAPGMTAKQIDKAVQDAAREFEAQIESGFSPDNKLTFSEYAEHVLALKERNGAKHKTIESYRFLLRRINPIIGHLKLQKIMPTHLNALYTSLGKKGVRADKGKAIAKDGSIQALLKSLKMSHKKAAEMAGLSPATLDTICKRGPVSIESAEKVCAAFGLDMKKNFLTSQDTSPLSNKSLLEYHRCVHTILAQAEKEMIVAFNAADRADPPKAVQKEVNYFQPGELSLILDALDAEPIKWRTIVNLLIVSGCRRGEIAALKWKNVDFKNSKIKIDSTLLYSSDRGIYENATKTGDVRFLKLPAETMAILREYKKYWFELRAKNGDRWKQSDYVFVRDDGTVIHPDSITAYLRRFSAKHPELPHINPHAFRHTVASVLINNGQDIVTVSRRLGHSRTSTTLDVYSHLIAEADADASEVIADALLRRKA